MNERNKDMLRLSALQFSLWELHVYLDTHPDDEQAIEKYKKASKEYGLYLAEFESKYGPITMPAVSVEWLKDPWPWELTGESED